MAVLDTEVNEDGIPLVTLEGEFKLTPREKQAMVYFAQGKKKSWIKTKLAMADNTLHYLLQREDARRFVSELTQGVHLQLEAMTVLSVEAIRDTLVNGKHPDKIKAARLQMEATKRIGSMTMPLEPLIDANLRLTQLSERLLMLNDNSKREIQTRRTEHGYEIVQERIIDPAAQAVSAGKGDYASGEAG